MGDKYSNYSELAKNERRGQHYRIRFRIRKGATVVVAPHGGGIEPGTSELADAIASHDLSFYAFDGMKSRSNHYLHITSSRFDEPHCVTLVKDSNRVIGVHGENSDGKVVYLGGRDKTTLDRLRISLAARGFCVKRHQNPALQGEDPANICNRGRNGCGVQLELSNGLRCSFFRSLSKNGRLSKTQRFWDFVNAVREVIR